MEYNDKFNSIKSYLSNNNESFYYFGPQNKENMMRVINNIQSDFDIWYENGIVSYDKNRGNDFMFVCSVLKHSVLEKPITNDFRNFVINLSICILNWITNIKKQDGSYTGDNVGDSQNWNNIEIDIKCVSRFVQLHYSAVELISVVKHLNKTLNEYKGYYYPPVNLAKHYLKGLDGNENCSGNVEGQIQNKDKLAQPITWSEDI